jgi:hypothetical protein
VTVPDHSCTDPAHCTADNPCWNRPARVSPLDREWRAILAILVVAFVAGLIIATTNIERLHL